MTLAELLFDLEEPDHVPIDVDAMKLEVEFYTINRNALSLLSVYYNDGKITIDIGEDGE